MEEKHGHKDEKSAIAGSRKRDKNSSKGEKIEPSKNCAIAEKESDANANAKPEIWFRDLRNKK